MYAIEPRRLGSETTSWNAQGVHCARDRHRFSGQCYSFSFEILDLRFEGPPRPQWHVVIVSEQWRFSGAKAEPCGTKSLRVIQG